MTEQISRDGAVPPTPGDDASVGETALAAEHAATLDAMVGALAPARDRRFARELLENAAGMLADGTRTLDLKIAAAAVSEMREAFAMFAPYVEVPKVTIFGSARTRPDDPLYEQARQVAASLAGMGWMTVTGAGPGIMEAGMRGAGADMSIGVSIRLPFEQGANSIIAGNPKYVSMKYFFTRKLMLVKESRGFVCLPGGFGTLDETFELLTLTQTGKGLPVPIVMLDVPGDPYWERVHEFISDQLVTRGLVAPSDTGLYRVTDSAEDAVDEITRFYASYDSLRYVGDMLVIRVRTAPDAAQLALLNEEFGHLCVDGDIHLVDAFPVEVREKDRLDRGRIAFHFAKHGYGDLRALIDRLNSFALESR